MKNNNEQKRPVPEDADSEIIRFMEKRKEENKALKKILNNLNTPQEEGKNKK